jgi:hypothetical protein
MIGLSTTAIGLRPTDACMEIFSRLQSPLQLDFLELAIGASCAIDYPYPEVPLLLHDSCLYSSEGLRLRLDLRRPQTWQVYVEFVAHYPVLAASIHAPLQRDMNRQELEKALQLYQDRLQVPVYLEVMPSPEYWCSSPETLVDHPLLLDVSHVLIWYRGNQQQTEEACDRLLNSGQVKALHLSHNNGTADAHDLIPEDVWFGDRISTWRQDYLVTYESLPVSYAEYQRLDKRKPRRPR